MTLYRKLLGMILAFFMLLLGLVYSLEFTYTRAYLTKQMASDVQNTVTTLGLSLQPYLETRDEVGVRSVLNAVFDGGYFREIRVEMAADEAGQPEVIQRTLSTTIENIPAWFTDLALFEPVIEQTVLTSGWLQLGTLIVEGHPGYAYQQLWQLMTQLLLWLLLAFIAFALLAMYGLRYLLKPLHLLEERALDISHQHFGQPLPEPRLPELSGLVSAFNTMSQRLQATFAEQASEAEVLRLEAFQDRVTGLGNRRFFNGQLEQWLAEGSSGGVLLMEMQAIEQVYREEGFEGRNQLMKATADLLRKLTTEVPDSVLARISNHEFAALLPGLDVEQLEQLAARLFQGVGEAVVSPFEQVESHCRIGVAFRRDAESANELLSQADLALQQAKRDPQCGYRVQLVETGQVVLGREGWKQLALQAMKNHWLYLQEQPVMAMDDSRCLHREIFCGILRGETRYAAGQFMPFVEQYGLGSRFDREVIELIDRMGANSLGHPVAVNLALDALVDPEFVDWLVASLRDKPALAASLVVEVPADSIKLHYSALESLCHQLRDLGVAYGFDRYGHSFERLGLLAELRPHYIKVDISYLLDEEGEETSSFVTALARFAHTQQAQVIVTRVESPAQLELLRRLPVDGYQGYLCPPRDIAIPD